MSFDPDTFLNETVTEDLSTDYVPVPEGEFPAVIKEVKARVAKTSTILDVTWSIDDQGARDATGMEDPTVRQSIFLDISDSGNLDLGRGKNVQLGRLREALDQNRPGMAWTPNMLHGQPALVLVSHREWEGRTYADIKSVAAV